MFARELSIKPLLPKLISAFTGTATPSPLKLERIVDPLIDEDFIYPVAGTEAALDCRKGRHTRKARTYKFRGKTVKIEFVTASAEKIVYLLDGNEVSVYYHYKGDPKKSPLIIDLFDAEYVAERVKRSFFGTRDPLSGEMLHVSKRDEAVLYEHLSKGVGFTDGSVVVRHIDYPEPYATALPKLRAVKRSNVH